MKTINILKELLRPPDDQVRKWIDIAAANLFNETAVGMTMAMIRTDAHALYFCDIMEKLSDSESSKMYIEILKKGNFIITINNITVFVCTYIHTYGHLPTYNPE